MNEYLNIYAKYCTRCILESTYRCELDIDGDKCKNFEDAKKADKKIFGGY